MTSPEMMTDVQRMEKLEDDVQRLWKVIEHLNTKVIPELQSQIVNGEKVVATAVLETLKDEVVITQIVQKTVEAIEAEWTGKFLPELRKTVQADVRAMLASGSEEL